MIRFTLTTLLFLSLFTYASAQSLSTSAEPTTQLDVFIDGQLHQLNEGDTLKVGGHEIVVKTSDTKHFDFGVLAFDYPKHYAYEHEKDFAYENWTLDGSSFIISYFELGIDIGLDAFVTEMVNRFGKKNCKVSDKQAQLGDLKLSGKRINIEIFGEKLTYDMYRLTTDDKKSHFIAFQDSKGEDGSDSQEGMETMKIIDQSIQQQ